ncbi:MAG: hypothetical protein HF962_05705 [Sulfurovum sp.]|nr:hypothetical protein [Sulfurovum sp.]
MIKKIPFLKVLFAFIFIFGAYYINFIQTQKYLSESVVAIKDLANKQSVTSVGSMILGQGDINSKQNLELITVYIRSREVFKKLDQEYNLSSYYAGNMVDLVQRLRKNSLSPFNNLDIENIMLAYNSDLETVYDELSSTLNISFYHADAKLSQKIINRIISYAEKAINKFDNESAMILAKFLKTQEVHYRDKLAGAIKKIITFQNREGLIDPKIDIEATSTLLASLESELIKLNVEYQSTRVTYTANTTKARSLKKQIEGIDKKIDELRKKLAGKGDKKLNRDQFAFEVLKNDLKFNQELYYQTLLKLEDAKISTNQNSKKLIVVVSPTLSEQYARPNKIRNTFTLFIILLFLFSILKVSVSLLREHKD